VPIKDYYTILELAPSASLDDIKKAYRRLAHLYHPDKRGDDPYAIAQFSEIKEAYEVLTHPLKKAYYLQQRWYEQSTGRKVRQEIITPVTILKQMLELERYVRTLDIHRMDKEGLYHHIVTILSKETIQKLNSFKEPDTSREIVLVILTIAHVLPLHFATELTEHLKRLYTDKNIEEKMTHLISQKKKADIWEKRKIWLILAAVAALCLVIFLAAR
jgi:molecular chaperone DnaJ